MYSSQLAEESGLLLPKDAPRGKRRGVTAALVALCLASGVAFSTALTCDTLANYLSDRPFVTC